MYRAPFLLLGVLSSALMMAQNDPAPPANGDGPCILATPVATWTTLGVSEDQLERIRSIQAHCHADCQPANGLRTRDPELTGAVVRKYEEEVEAILGKERTAKWREWCKERPARM